MAVRVPRQLCNGIIPIMLMIYAIGVVYGETAVNCSDWRAILSGDERFQKFAAFVDKMDALDVMTSRGNHTTPGATFTILAPVNEAMTSWQRKYEIQDDAQNDDAKRDAVNAIMSYHILVDGSYNTTMMANTFGFATWKYKSGLDDLPVLVQVSDTQKKYRQNRMQCLQSLCACLNGSIRFFFFALVLMHLYIYIYGRLNGAYFSCLWCSFLAPMIDRWSTPQRTAMAMTPLSSYLEERHPLSCSIRDSPTRVPPVRKAHASRFLRCRTMC